MPLLAGLLEAKTYYLLFVDMQFENSSCGCGSVIPKEQAWKALARARKSKTVRNPRLIEVAEHIREITSEDELK